MLNNVGELTTLTNLYFDLLNMSTTPEYKVVIIYRLPKTLVQENHTTQGNTFMKVLQTS